jgi:hypothetical protein
MAAMMLASTGLVFGQAMPSTNPTPKPEAVRPEGRVFESAEGGFRIRLPKGFRDPIRQYRVNKKTGSSYPVFFSLGDRGAFNIFPAQAPTGINNSIHFLRLAADESMKALEVKSEQERNLNRKGEVGFEIYAKGRFNNQPRFVRFWFLSADHLWCEVSFVSIGDDNRDDADITAALETFEILPLSKIKATAPKQEASLDFKAPDGSFRIELAPGFQEPIDQSELLASRIREMKASQFLSSGPSGLLIMSRFSEIREMNTKAQIAQVREGITAGIIQSFKGRILSSKPIVRGGVACQELRFTGELSGQIMNGRGLIFSKKGEVLLILYLSPSDEALDSQETERMFDSIKLNP